MQGRIWVVRGRIWVVQGRIWVLVENKAWPLGRLGCPHTENKIMLDYVTLMKTMKTLSVNECL